MGSTQEVQIGSQIKIMGTLVSQEYSQKVASLADEGFPWQMSIRIVPKEIFELRPSETVVINGQSVTGPLTVFQDSTIREVSFCALGADRDTIAHIFNLKEKRMENKPIPDKDRDLAIQALNDEKNQFKADLETFKSKNTQFAADNAELKGQVKALEFERRTLSESLVAARKETEDIRVKFKALSKSSRQMILAEDFKKLNLSFNLEDDSIKAIMSADDLVFEAFRKTLGTIKPVMTPPPCAFESQTADSQFKIGPPAKTLAERAKEYSKKETKNAH
jgi:hypothetical protein